MKRYGIQSANLTLLNMRRIKLVTKENAKNAYRKKWKSDYGELIKNSINDDLENFFNNIQNGKYIRYSEKQSKEYVQSFFTPKLTDEELKLVEEKNEEHLQSYQDFYFKRNPDVDPAEMKRSDSESKYVKVWCYRRTSQLTLELNKFYCCCFPVICCHEFCLKSIRTNGIRRDLGIYCSWVGDAF